LIMSYKVGRIYMVSVLLHFCGVCACVCVCVRARACVCVCVRVVRDIKLCTALSVKQRMPTRMDSHKQLQ
jgi:hypothetical protein